MPAQTAPAVEEAQVHELVERRVAAVRAKNVDALLFSYAPDIVMFNLAPPLLATGTDRHGLETWLASFQGPIGYELRDLRVTVGVGVAFSHSLNRLSGTRTDGQQVDMWSRATVCYRKLGNQWLVVHEHNSVPFDMETGRALVDLQP
ncbi:MAG TPA: nuclear transport factor 2 family protein [Chloroflexota bacterium]|jgi:ketosteroid isomerase-like protein